MTRSIRPLTVHASDASTTGGAPSARLAAYAAVLTTTAPTNAEREDHAVYDHVTLHESFIAKLAAVPPPAPLAVYVVPSRLGHEVAVGGEWTDEATGLIYEVQDTGTGMLEGHLGIQFG